MSDHFHCHCLLRISHICAAFGQKNIIYFLSIFRLDTAPHTSNPTHGSVAQVCAPALPKLPWMLFGRRTTDPVEQPWTKLHTLNTMPQIAREMDRVCSAKPCGD